MFHYDNFGASYVNNHEEFVAEIYMKLKYTPKTD